MGQLAGEEEEGEGSGAGGGVGGGLGNGDRVWEPSPHLSGQEVNRQCLKLIK